MAIISLEESCLKTVATMESQVEGSEFRTMAAKFPSDISALTDLVCVNFFLNRVMWAGKSPFAVKKMFLNSVSAFNHPT